MSHSTPSNGTYSGHESGTVGQRVASAAEDAKEALTEGASQTQDAMLSVQSKAQEVGRTATQKGTAFVQENPGMALAGAVGLGVLLGLAIRPRY